MPLKPPAIDMCQALEETMFCGAVSESTSSLAVPVILNSRMERDLRFFFCFPLLIDLENNQSFQFLA